MRVNPQLANSQITAHRALLAQQQQQAAKPSTGALDPKMDLSAGRPMPKVDLSGGRPMPKVGEYIRPDTGTMGGPQTADMPNPPPVDNTDSKVQYLMDMWGTDDAHVDFDGSGVVDANDLAILLSYGAGQSAPEPAGGDDGATESDYTLEGLLAAWGQADSAYDVNSDGTVDAQDLAEFLSNPPSATPPTTENEDTPDDLSELMAAWGQADSMYDLNADGTVDAADLAQFLAGQGSTPPQQPAVVDPPSSQPIQTPAPGGGNGNSTVPYAIATAIFDSLGAESTTLNVKEINGPEGLLNKLDVDNDGTIRKRDLFFAIEHSLQNAQASNPDLDVRGFAKHWMDAFDANRMPTPAGMEDDSMNKNRLDRLADALTNRFEKAGFQNSPPANMHELLDNLNLGNSEKSYVLGRLGDMYPQGLGVNYIG